MTPKTLKHIIEKPKNNQNKPNLFAVFWALLDPVLGRDNDLASSWPCPETLNPGLPGFPVYL